LSLDDVGDASYAAVPELGRIHRSGAAVYWNLYAMVAIIELARSESQNLEVPDWLREDYFRSIQGLAQMGTEDILSAAESETKRAIISIIAIARGLRTHGIPRSVFRGRAIRNGAIMSVTAVCKNNDRAAYNLPFGCLDGDMEELKDLLNLLFGFAA
jgi:hypothetical protein